MPVSNSPNSNRKVPRSSKKRVRAPTILLNQKKSLESKLKLSSEFGGNWVSLSLPVRTISELNCTIHWSKKYKLHKIQQKTVALVLNPMKTRISIPCHIHLIRLAPNKLDKHDNLPASLKYIVDACCAIITGDFRPGRGDNDERISFSYDQEESKNYGVKILFTFKTK